MIIGNILLYLGLASVLAGFFFYFRAMGGRANDLKYGRWATIVLAVVSVLASGYLLSLILTDQFQFEYVWENSSTTLAIFYKISALWGGQEGSFLLWLTFGALYALVMSRVFQRDEVNGYEAPTMLAMMTVQIFPLVMLLTVSPFRIAAGIPVEGRGLNPLLLDPYMVIHPPLLFLGFAGLQTTFAFAMAALRRRDYQGWVQRSWPWTLIGWTFLGLGLSLGAFWAYRVLGWGGYWGWDPVENSSLVPWLLAGALVHGLLVQKTRGRLARWNLFLSLATYISILYSTFLTRSGVLADFSVHSFAESPLMRLMLIVLAHYVVIPAIFFIVRYREIPSGSDSFKSLASRDFSSLVVVIAFIFMAVAVAIGTSSPLITGMVAGSWLLCGDNGLLLGLGSAGVRLCAQSNVATSFYESMSGPLLFVFAVAMMIAPILAWQESRARKLLQMLRWPFIVAVAGTILAGVLMMHEPASLALFFFSLFALGINGVMIERIVRANVWNIGGYLAHVGVALAIVGIIGTSVYKQTEHVVIFEGGTGKALGYTIEFRGLEQVTEDKWAAQLLVRRGPEAFIATPKLQPTDQGMVRTPHVHKYLTEDLYIAPGDYDSGQDAGEILELAKGESKDAAGYTITFVDYSRSGHDSAGGQAISVGAILQVARDGVTQIITPTVVVDMEGSLTAEPVALPGTTIEIYLHTPQPGAAVVGVVDTASAEPPTPPSMSLEVIREPGINFLWVGLIVIAAGTGVAAVRRRKEGRRASGLAAPYAPVVVSPARTKTKTQEPAQLRQQAQSQQPAQTKRKSSGSRTAKRRE